MKKLLVLSALLLAAASLEANPGKGGYLGHRVIVGGEFAYAPFYNSVNAFITKYNIQYGGNLNVIVGRRTQVGLSYNMWSLGGNELFDDDHYVSGDRIKGSQYGLTVRNFRKNRGGLAPIGKFYDIGLSYAMNEVNLAADNPTLISSGPPVIPPKVSVLSAHAAFGTQMVFWDHVVANTGLRFGAPLYVSSDNNVGTSFMYKRFLMKEAFSVFFGVGILI